MNLRRARIENFRILKEIDLEFSRDAARSVTIIRAANESGKTTLLTALQWGLFGDKALPGEGRDYRLSPLDASQKGGSPTTIRAEIDYEDAHRQTAYRIIRTVVEDAGQSPVKRRATDVKLFEINESGASPIDNPQSHVESHLPRELREVFFTDGDRALNFIEGSRGDTKRQVEQAIRSLLGLQVIENASDHLDTVLGRINKRVKKQSGNRKDLQESVEKIERLRDEIPELERIVSKSAEARRNLRNLEQEAERELSNALRKGNRADLERERQAAMRGRSAAEEDTKQAVREESNLFRHELLGRHLLEKPFRKAGHILDGLHRRGQIPKQSIPVLKDRLTQNACICGETLNQDDAHGQERRKAIQRLIDDSKAADQLQKKVTALYYEARNLWSPIAGATWPNRYRTAAARVEAARLRRKECGERERAAEIRIRDLQDADVRQLQETRDRYRAQLEDAQRREVRSSAELETKRAERKTVEAENDRLLQHDKHNMKHAAELEVARDLRQVLDAALETMKRREVKKVSDLMNELFLKMIGRADEAESQRAIIVQAKIDPETFRITVVGRHEQYLDPSQDLNGASRRALTIAFVLALTRVSEVEAPNVIDTPLGMTSGYVRTAILKLAAERSSQLILFLTHDEIIGCEEILDRYAGRVYTLTNPAHYPTILVNDPGVDDARVLLCGCGHRGHCTLCERRAVVDVDVVGDGKEMVS